MLSNHIKLSLCSLALALGIFAPFTGASANQLHTNKRPAVRTSVVKHRSKRLSSKIRLHYHNNNTHKVSSVNSNANLQIKPKTSHRQFHKVYRIAKSKLGDPYVYGATGSNRFDCSGFTRYIYQHGAHKMLPRTAQAQYNATLRVVKPHRGDLVFIGSSSRSIYHVGMMIGHHRMIDAQNSGVKRESVPAPWWHVVGYGHVK